MQNSIKLLVFLFFSFVSSQNFNENSYMEVYLIADTGKALARCNGCGPGAYSDSASVHANIGDPWAKFKIFSGADGKVAIQADTGKYVARCNGCWSGGAYPDAGFVHETNPNNPWAQWTLVANSDGTYGFQSDTGRFLARCNGCVPRGATPDFAFVHSTNQNDPWVKWRLVLAE